MLTHLKAQAAPATRAASLIQAWAFCVHSLGFFDPTALEHSLRCGNLVPNWFDCFGRTGAEFGLPAMATLAGAEAAAEDETKPL